MPTTVSKKTGILDENCNDPVLLQTEDEDRFLKTQREIVGAVRSADDFLTQAKQVSQQFNTMMDDLKAKCLTNPSVAKCVLAPRSDDILIVVIASDDDPEGGLDDWVSTSDLEMFGRNQFRLSWLMLRASEASGLRSFVDPKVARTLYSAK